MSRERKIEREGELGESQRQRKRDRERLQSERKRDRESTEIQRDRVRGTESQRPTHTEQTASRALSSSPNQDRAPPLPPTDESHDAILRLSSVFPGNQSSRGLQLIQIEVR